MTSSLPSRDAAFLLARSDTPRPEILDALEATAVEAVQRCYDIAADDTTARFWVQKGIEGMRLAVALALEEGEA